MKVGHDNCAFVHVVYLPYLGASGELKTKPAQNAVRELRGLGIVPDVLVARSEGEAPNGVIEKLSLFSGVDSKAIVLLPNAKTIYQVPLTLEERGIGAVLSDRLHLTHKKANLNDWQNIVERALDTAAPRVKVGIVAKYLNNQDTYMSVFEALRSAAWARGKQVDIVWVDAEKLEHKNVSIAKELQGLQGIVVPGGFGPRGIEGKIAAAQYALTNKLPYLGLCLGLQVAVIAAVRNAGISDANSTEFSKDSKHFVIATMDEQKGKEGTGGTMRLGNYECVLQKGSLAQKVYNAHSVLERHRHRYECSNQYVDQYEKWGLKASGKSPDGSLVEMIEGIDHPFILASQAHPELKSRPTHPHPMFVGFIDAASKNV
jgi:CTP synthase